MTCGCSGGECCKSDSVEVVQRTREESKRPAEKGGCCQGKGHASDAGGKVARLCRDDAYRQAVGKVKLPCGCSSEGDCFHEEAEKGKRLPCGCRSEGDCFHEEVKGQLACGCKDEGDCLVDGGRKGKLPCGCKFEGDCFGESPKKFPCGCKAEGDCFQEQSAKVKLECGCKSEGDCFDDAPKKLPCGCKAEGDCFQGESEKKVKLECGCKSEGDCFHEEEKKAPKKDSCCCKSGKPCCHKMSGEHKSKGSCCQKKGSCCQKKGSCCRKKKKEAERLACGCKSEGDCFHEETQAMPGRLPCGCKAEGDCFDEIPKKDPCRLACGCKSEGDCFHEVIKQIPKKRPCGCQDEGDCKESRGDKKDGKVTERLELSGPRTDEIYRTFNIPTRFMYPKLLKGYRDKGTKFPHPCYRATSTDYGWFSPTVHTVPTTYYPRDYAFSVERSRGGMYRNCSLNTDLDKHFP